MFDTKRVPGCAVCLTLTALLAACGTAPPGTPATLVTQTPPSPSTPIPASATLAEQNLPPTAASEGVLPAATLAANAAAGPTPEPSPTPLYPLAIEAMRARDYPGSDIAIEQSLAPGSNYQRYLASYQSDGLKIYALMTVPDGDRPPTGWPVIVFNHGFIQPERYRTTERYVAYQDALAQSGYITLKSDYRGNGDSEGTPSGHFAPGTQLTC